MMNSKLAKAGQFAYFFFFFNFVVFAVVSISIGGDAINGHSENGRYFLNSHGKLTETSHAVFLYSSVHTYFTVISAFIALFGRWYHSAWKKQNEIADLP